MIRLKNVSQIRILFLLTAVFLLSLSFISYQRIKGLSRSAELLNHTTVVKLELEKTYSALMSIETVQRGYLLNDDAVFVRSYNETVKNLDSHFNKLDSLTEENTTQQQNLVDLRRLAERRINYLKISIADGSTQKVNRARWLRGKSLMDEVKLEINKMLNEEDRLLAIQTIDVRENQLITPWIILLLIVTCILILWLTYNKINDDLKIARNLQLQLEKRTVELEQNNIELNEQKTFVETILDCSIDNISVLDKDLRFLTINKKAEELICT